MSNSDRMIPGTAAASLSQAQAGGLMMMTLIRGPGSRSRLKSPSPWRRAAPTRRRPALAGGPCRRALPRGPSPGPGLMLVHVGPGPAQRRLFYTVNSASATGMRR
jgi:hypothetical protein